MTSGVMDETMSDEPPPSSRNRADATRHEHGQSNSTKGWALTMVIVGALIMVASIIPSLLKGQHIGLIVLGDAEVIPVFEMVLLVLGLLIVIQGWSGLS
jgi:hypothetical protein